MNCDNCGKEIDIYKKHVILRAQDRVTKIGAMHYKCWVRPNRTEDEEE